MLKIYPKQFALAAVAANAVGVAVAGTVKITDGEFVCKTLSVSAFDATGALIDAPHVALKMSVSGQNLFADDVDLAGLTRNSRYQFELPEPITLKQLAEIKLIATPQPGSTVAVLNLNFIGTQK